MSTRSQLIWTVLILSSMAATVVASPGKHEVKPSPVKSDWKARSMAWLKTQDEKSQRKEMRAATKALRKPCRYCHTRDFKGYTEKRLISQQMMALSNEHDVQCNVCHAGKKGLTPQGRVAEEMWDWSIELGVFCGDCHPKGDGLKKLNPKGEKSLKEWKKRRKKSP
jgi:nitrate/TMAO reductase-like tetraheme cytochrome c subunit